MHQQALPKSIPQGGAGKFSLIRNNFSNNQHPPDRLLNKRLVPIVLAREKGIFNTYHRSNTDKGERQPISNSTKPYMKIPASNKSCKMSTINTAATPGSQAPVQQNNNGSASSQNKTGSSIEYNKFQGIKKNFLDTSLDSGVDDKSEFNLLLPQSKLLFKGTSSKTRNPNVLLAPLQQPDKTNLAGKYINQNSYSSNYANKKRMRSMMPKRAGSGISNANGSYGDKELSFISEKHNQSFNKENDFNTSPTPVHNYNPLQSHINNHQNGAGSHLASICSNLNSDTGNNRAYHNKENSFSKPQHERKSSKKHEKVPLLNLRQNVLQPPSHAQSTQNAKSSRDDGKRLNSDRPRENKYESNLTPGMNRKGSEPSPINQGEQNRVRRFQQRSEFGQSPMENKIRRRKQLSYHTEIDKSLSVESTQDYLMLASHAGSIESKARSNLRSNKNLLESGKQSIDQSKRFNTSQSIGNSNNLDDAYDKLTELTSRTKNARGDLLKIQESVVELEAHVSSFRRKRYTSSNSNPITLNKTSIDHCNTSIGGGNQNLNMSQISSHNTSVLNHNNAHPPAKKEDRQNNKYIITVSPAKDITPSQQEG